MSIGRQDDPTPNGSPASDRTAGWRGPSAPALLQLLREGRLTPFQVAAIQKGKGNALILGEYIILGLINKHTTSIVYKAQHAMTGQVVALKVLPAARKLTHETLRRFRREVKASTALRHPNLITAYDAGQSRGVAFLALEYVEGQTLEVLVKRGGPLTIDRAVDYVIQAAQGLGHAHAMGVVHRDISPRNLIVSFSASQQLRAEDAILAGDASQGRVRVLNLGLARLIAPAGPQTTITMDVGNTEYIAPEQSLDPHQADHRSDIYSLGAVLHFLLTGRPVFTGKSPARQLLSHQQNPIPVLSERRPDVPPSLDVVFRTMLAKSPDDRYPNTDELIDALNEVIAVRPVAASGAPVKLDLRRPERPSRLPRVITTLAAILGLGLLAVGLYLGRQSSPMVSEPTHTPEERHHSTPTDDSVSFAMSNPIVIRQFDFTRSGGSVSLSRATEITQGQPRYRYRITPGIENEMDQNDTLSIRVVEDNETISSDGIPGVLRIEVQDPGIGTGWIGIDFLGDSTSDGIAIIFGDTDEKRSPPLTQLAIQFRYRLERDDGDVTSGSVPVRFRVVNPGGRREECCLRFNVGHATNNWADFRARFSSAEGIDTFVATHDQADPPIVQLSWQFLAEHIREGDALLIDDVRLLWLP